MFATADAWQTHRKKLSQEFAPIGIPLYDHTIGNPSNIDPASICRGRYIETYFAAFNAGIDRLDSFLQPYYAPVVGEAEEVCKAIRDNTCHAVATGTGFRNAWQIAKDDRVLRRTNDASLTALGTGIGQGFDFLLRDPVFQPSQVKTFLSVAKDLRAQYHYVRGVLQQTWIDVAVQSAKDHCTAVEKILPMWQILEHREKARAAINQIRSMTLAA